MTVNKLIKFDVTLMENKSVFDVTFRLSDTKKEKHYYYETLLKGDYIFAEWHYIGTKV